MTIEEMADKWAEQKIPFNPITGKNFIHEAARLQAMADYEEVYRAALTSLLEELPEVDKTDYSAIIYQTAYREKIKSLIQNKLK